MIHLLFNISIFYYFIVLIFEYEIFKIENNEFLSDGPIKAYYHEEYSADMGERDNYSGYIHVLKNTFNEKPQSDLQNAANVLFEILLHDLKVIAEEEDFNDDVLVIGVPRAQTESSYNKNQLLFRSTISEVTKLLGYEDGNSAVIRIKDTKTTHISNPTTLINNKLNNSLLEPFPGISRETCDIRTSLIHGKNIILIDDVYTKTANIAEDLIQALIDLGAKMVVFYSCWYTIK